LQENLHIGAKRMTPAARLSAAIAVLDRVLAGAPAEQALTNWGRSSRFAGSGDRAAVRDTVFAALRCRRSFAALGGAETGRGLVLGGVRAAGVAPETLFTGQGHAPAPLTEAEGQDLAPLEQLVALDCPDWLAPELQRSLGSEFAAVMQALQLRAPVFLRVNRARLTRDEAQARLAAEDISSLPHGLAPDALEVTGNARKISGSAAYLDGLVELQDVASQAVAEAVPLTAGAKVLDYCAGGGGKTLALAARLPLRLFAHDAEPKRMRDLPERASRAGIQVRLLDTAAVAREAPFDLVLADAPCSGSGSWRRDPEGKWRLTQERLDALCALQARILDSCAGLVSAKGRLAYATCSLLEAENHSQAAGFLVRHPGWHLEQEHRLTPLQGGDGFYLAILARG
jgi:16S rRNA (cytosine967-C5)-methyltransferase